MVREPVQLGAFELASGGDARQLGQIVGIPDRYGITGNDMTMRDMTIWFPAHQPPPCHDRADRWCYGPWW